MLRRVTTAGRAAAVVAIAVALALAYGQPYGSSNQQTYLLAPLQHAFPELYRHDWFVSTAHQYHFVFTWLVAPLYGLDASGVIALGLLQLVVMVATYVLVYRLIAAVTDRARLPLFALLAALLTLGAGRALGGSYLFAGYVQPSSLAVLGWLGALVLWLRERPLAAGLALAAGGACHLNYALLGIAIFGAAELATYRIQPRRLAMLLVPSLAVVAVFVPAMLASSHSSEPDLALRVLVDFEFPGHFEPKHVRRWIWPLAAWLAAAWSVLPVVRGPAFDRLWRFACTGALACIAAALVVSIPPLLSLTRLFVWRVAPIPQLACQLIVLAGVLALAREGVRALGRQRLAVLALALLGLVVEAFRLQPGEYGYVLIALAAGAGVLAFVRREQLLIPLAALVCAFALFTHRAALAGEPLFVSYDSGLTEWARETTPVDAVFLVPPYENEFRLLARRAIVVDTKSPPMYMDELVAWYRRLCATVGAGDDVATYLAAEAHWDTLGADQLVAIAHQFAADYLVVDKTRSQVRLASPVAYEDNQRVAYRLR